MSDRTYEILFIADPNLGEPEVDALTTTISGFVEKEGGKIAKNEKWGKKRLAYLIGRHREGSYVLLTVEGSGSIIKEVERRIRVTDGVIRFITVRVDEDLKKAERRKGQRTAAEEKRRAKGHVPRPAAPAAPVVTEDEGVQQ
ncbi:MAG: 30S ribosomal protein S6 [Vicinamibacteria bacterium]|nr:30S ribosomal protein S6 [Vicinamibacteria bacterium]